MKPFISLIFLILVSSNGLAQETVSVGNPACLSHLTKDIPKDVGWYADCSAALQRASRRTIGKFCREEPLHNDPRVVDMKLEAITDFKNLCRCEEICE